MLSLAALLFTFEPASLGPCQGLRGRSRRRQADGRWALVGGIDSPAQRVEFGPQFAAFDHKGVALALQPGAGLLDPPEPFLLLIELTPGDIELLLQPLSDFTLSSELYLKLPDGVPRECEIVTVVERD